MLLLTGIVCGCQPGDTNRLTQQTQVALQCPTPQVNVSPVINVPPATVRLLCPELRLCPERPACRDDLTQWKERFDGSEDLQKNGDFAGARDVLIPGLWSCDRDVRSEVEHHLAGLIPPTGCPGPAVWKERFERADALRARHDDAAVCALLLPALGDCDASVRLQALNALPASCPAAPSVCRGKDPTPLNLGLLLKLILTERIEEWRAFVQVALRGCDTKMCQKALVIFNGSAPAPPPPKKSFWSRLIDDLGDAFELVFKVLLGASIALALAPLLLRVLAIWPLALVDVAKRTFDRPRPFRDTIRAVVDSWRGTIARFWRHPATSLRGACGALVRALRPRRMSIDPLIVSGQGFDGSRFVTIVRSIDYRLAALHQLEQDVATRLRFGGTAGAANVTAADLRLLTDDAPDHGDLLSALAETLAGDSAGKLAAALVKFIFRPYYRCTGALSIDHGRTEILVTVRAGRRLIASWRNSSTPDELFADLEECALAILQQTRNHLRGRDDGLATA